MATPTEQNIFEFNEDEESQFPEEYGLTGYLLVKIGDLFQNRYTVIRKLGRGTYSTVWLCSDTKDIRLKALKIARCGFTQLIKVEIRLLESVENCPAEGSHKIVQLLDNFTIPGSNGDHICMVFEVLGASLSQLIETSGPRGFSIPIVKTIMRQVLEGLDFLHTKCNIIHTDIKPENICVGENDMVKLAKWRVEAVDQVSVKIADLGSSCWVNHHFQELIQTCCYRSPEVLLGVGYGTSADIWSAACTAFDLATGSYLFGSHLSESLKEDEEHLAEIVRLFGDIPLQMVFSGKICKSLFTDEGKLRNFPKIERCGLVELFTKKFRWNVGDAQEFADFLVPMLAINPNKRCSAMESLGHRWLQF